ncbi:MAG TPA: cation-translocating P-type ATPase [Clostridia bacterium]|nr:cation-translocating P-type ATPase [Clostridia bacterium]
MLKRLSDFLFGWKMTVVSGVFLAASLVLLLTGAKLAVDPAWVTVLISGYPLLYLAISRLIRQRWISSALLITIAMIASIIIGELFAAGEVAFIMAIGALLEDMTVEKAKKGIHNLMKLTPRQARRLIDGTEELVPIEEIHLGDLLRVLPGEVIPTDGVVFAGNTSVDQSVMTGESLPVDKAIDDTVFCGTMNCFGSVDIKTTQLSKDSSLQKMIDMVAEAENKKAPMQRIVDKWATWLVPIALAIAVIAYVITKDVVRAVTVLVVFCPCALALATPTSIIAAIGQATKHGVIIKSGEALENMGKADTIAFDKTGTLTKGNLTVSDTISLLSGLSESDLLLLTAAAEARSEHPLGKAILSQAKQTGESIAESDDFTMIPGKGVMANVHGETVLCGSSTFLTENGVTITKPALTELEALQGQGKAVILVAKAGQLAGLIALSDTLRPAVKDMVGQLTSMGVKTVLLTGDNARTATYLSKQVGITEVKADLLPGDKVSAVVALQAQGRKVCMIGDGVNDAPALKTANVSVAMGGMGSDIAIEAADIALMGDDINKIPYLKQLSNTTLRTIKTNITVSMCINFVAVTLSVLGLLNPVTGALVHNAGSVLVVLNAAMLYQKKI